MQTLVRSRAQQTKKVSKTITLFVPTNLNLNDLNTVLTGDRGTSSLLRGCLYLYTYIYTSVLNDLRNQNPEDEHFPGYTQVSRTILRSFLGDNYSEVMQLLLNNDYLTMLRHNKEGEYFPDGFYYCGDNTGRCKSYKIPQQLQGNSKLFRVLRETVTKRDLDKLEAVKSGRMEYKEHYRELMAQNMQNVILLDTPEARAQIDQLYTQQKVRATAEDYLDIFNSSPLPETPICDFGHRVHSHVVNTNKVLRPYMRFRGDLEDPLVEIDLVNSQPAILANITPKLINKFAPECREAIPFFLAAQEHPSYQRFQQLCSNGIIYETLRDAFNAAYGDKLVEPLTRDGAKGVFYCAGFSKYSALERRSLLETGKELSKLILTGAPQDDIDEKTKHLFTLRSYFVFKQEFPGVHHLFKQIKSLNWSGFNLGEKHSNNCLLAQRIESGIVYTRLVKALLDGGIDPKKIVPIHDSLMVRESDEKKARKVVEKELKKLGLNIKLKEKK